MPKSRNEPKKKRTPPGKGLRVKIDGPFTAALRTSLRRKKPPEGWPKPNAKKKGEEE